MDFTAMMTPQQAFRIFVYADWAMLLAGVVAICMSIGWAIAAVLPRYKGRRQRVLFRALMSFLVFAMFWVVQASVMMAAFGNDRGTPLGIVLFILPAVAMLAGLLASVVYGIRAIRRGTGTDRRPKILKSLLGVAVFWVGMAPPTVAMLIPIISAEDHSNREGTLARAGDPVPDFELVTVEGMPFSTVELRGRVIVLNFFATWCGACQRELPHLQALWDEFRDNDDFRMLVIGRKESDDSLQAFQREHGFTFPMASDPDGSVYSQFASQSIPRTYLLSRQGTIVYQWLGAYEEEIPKLKRLLRRELAKKK